MNIDLSIPSINFEPISTVDYPSAGTGEFVGCNTASQIQISKTTALNAGSSSSSTGLASFLRVNSFSACKMPDNSALIAIASQNPDVATLPPTDDPIELANRVASRVHIISTPLGNYASCVRRATIVGVEEEPAGDCAQGIIDIEIDVGTDVWGDTKLVSLWPLDGDLAGIKFRIVSAKAPNIWRILPADKSITVDLSENRCFRFVAYGSSAPTYPNSLNLISPLPPITVDGEVVPSINPQIATNACAAPNLAPYVYVIAEAPVNGVSQLFFYGFKMGTQYEVFGWRQLTFDGENRNASVKCDSAGNLHVTWESSRCQPSQVYYGVIGPDSRAIANETLVAALDKQVANNPTSIPSLVSITSPAALDLRDIDENGDPLPGASSWSTLTENGGSVTLLTENSLTVNGNPRNHKFAGFASLRRDQDNVVFDGKFSQLSYQVSFDLNITATTNDWDETDVAEEFIVFKQTFAPSIASANNINVYTKNGKTYTIDEPKIVYDNIIPFVGSYKNDGKSQINLKHYMLVAIPEKVNFVAKSTTNEPDIFEQHYTGRFKLGVVFETSENASDHSLAYKKHHWVRMFGDPIKFNQSNNYKVAIHYSHLREESVWNRADNGTMSGPDQNVRFSGDIIVAVNNAVKVAESFIPDFSDQYHQFDLGFGCATVGEFRTLTLNPYDGSVNSNITVQMAYTNIFVGPHSIKANEYLTSFAASDRNVSKMVVFTDVNELDSLSSAEEAWIASGTYKLNLGLNRAKLGLSQVPVTNLGKNTSPSMALDRCGRAHIAYQSNRDGRQEIYYTSGVDVGMPFRFDTRITDSEGNSLSPTVSVDNEGRRLISWHDNRTGVYQIFAARSVEAIACNEGICTRDQLSQLGLEPFDGGPKDFEYDPYIDDPYYASICQLVFVFKNRGTVSKKYHFRANFYTDSAFTSFYKDVDSRLDISHWSVDGHPLAYNGVSVAPGQTVEVVYNVSKEDGLTGELYYVEFEADDGDSIKALDTTSLYFCPVNQGAKCVVPVVFHNMNLAAKDVHFRVTFYRDEELTQAVLTSSSQSYIRWSAGEGRFPTNGINVQPGEMVSAVYNPEFIDLSQSENRSNSNITALMCGVTYWIVAEAYYDSTYHTVDSFAIKCGCNDIKTHIWRKDTQSFGWHCSGQGGQDVRITSTKTHALFPQSDASEDGIVYVAWEDRRFAETKDTNNHYVYYGVWDARSDQFYSSAQGYKDREVTGFSKFRPSVIVNNMQHASFLFTDGSGMFTRTCSLYKTPKPLSSSSSAVSVQGDQGVFNQTPLTLSNLDVSKCLIARVYEEDVAEYYHKDASNPIALIEECKVRFEIIGPAGSYAVRFRNENEAGWSEWLNILPKLPNWPSSSSSGLSQRGLLDGYFIGDDRFIAPWVLSRGSGNKTVTCQVLTYSGISPEFSVDVIARYRDLKHKIEFFRDSAFNVPASVYNGTPVVSTQPLTVDADDATSITANVTANPTIYVKITFDDPKRLESLLQIANLRKYGSNGNITYDVYTQGFNKFDQPLNKVSSGVYTGSFTIGVDDGIDNKDGQAVVVVNIPTPCNNMRSSSSATCLTNLVKPSDIKLLRVADVQNAAVNLEKFKLRYNKELNCTFTSNQCVDGTDTYKEGESTNDTVGDKPTPTGAGFGCDALNWTSPRKAEKGFYLPNGGQNAYDWTITSPLFELDFSDSRIDYLKFDLESELDDVLFMVRPNESIIATVAPSGSSSSSGQQGGGANPVNVTFTVPQGSVLFAANEGYYCHGPSGCNNGSAAKAFFVSTTKFGQIPAGTVSNDGTGTMATAFNIAPIVPNAMGINDGSLVSSSSATYTNMLKTTFAVSVSKKELQARGFITANGILRFKLVHIPSGVGHAIIKGMTCGASCDLLSSSSSSSGNFVPTSSSSSGGFSSSSSSSRSSSSSST